MIKIKLKKLGLKQKFIFAEDLQKSDRKSLPVYILTTLNSVDIAYMNLSNFETTGHSTQKYYLEKEVIPLDF